MRDKVILFVCFVLISSMLIGQSSGADQPPAGIASASEEVVSEETQVSMIGFGFLKRGSKDVDKTLYVMHINYRTGKKMPVKGEVRIGTAREMNTFQLRIHSYSKELIADIVEKREKKGTNVVGKKAKNVDEKKKMVLVKIGEVRLKGSATEFKDKVQTGKLSLKVSKAKVKHLSGTYDVYLNVLPEITLKGGKGASEKAPKAELRRLK